MTVHPSESDPIFFPRTDDWEHRLLRRQGAYFRPYPLEVEEMWKTACWFFDLYDNSPNADFSLDLNGIIRGCNRKATKLLRYDRNQLLGISIHSLYADTPAGKIYSEKLFAESRRRTLIGGEELQMQKSDGTLIWITQSARPVYDDGDRIKEIRLAVLDISERKAGESYENQYLKHR